MRKNEEFAPKLRLNAIFLPATLKNITQTFDKHKNDGFNSQQLTLLLTQSIDHHRNHDGEDAHPIGAPREQGTSSKKARIRLPERYPTMLSPGTVSLQQPSLPTLHAPLADNTAGPSNIPPETTESAVENPPSPPPRSHTAHPQKPGLKAALGDRKNLQVMGQKLNEIAARLGENATPHAVLTALKTTPMDVHPDSSFPTEAGNAATVESFLKGTGLGLPTNHFQLTGHARAIGDRAQQHPLGSFGGGLSWPVPIGASAQHSVVAAANSFAQKNPNLPQEGVSIGVLEFLNRNQPLSGDALNDPAKALEHLISSPRGQALGQSIQTGLEGVATDTSVNEYTLTAINLLLDPESTAKPHRNKVAGFDLAQDAHWGKPAPAVLEGLSRHLSTAGKTTPEMAKVGAYLLLARRAPEFLIKDIPPSVTYGSPAWISLAVAAVTIEAQTPGRVPNMTFVQVMLAAENANLQNLAVTQQAQKAALVDWGVANGVLGKKDDERYTGEELNALNDTFNTQQKQRMTASHSLDKDIPTRKEIALAKLIERFGDLGPLFEEKLISTLSHAGPGNRTRLTGTHSLLDIAMMDLPNPAQFHSADDRIIPHLAALNANPRFGAADEFEQQFGATIKDKKAALTTTLQHLIGKLPIGDRKNLEYGAITFYQESSHTLGMGILPSDTPDPKNQELLVRIEQQGKDPVAYAINFDKGTIEPVGVERVQAKTSRTANRVFETNVFTPKGSEAHQRAETTPSSEAPPNSFSSTRTKYIADAFVEHFDLDNPQIKQQALGRTTYDDQRARAEPVEQFLLDLVPFRSAIVNFKKGNYGEGAADLALDVFGFLTAGVGTAVKVAKVGRSAASGAARILKGAKIIGTATVSAFNPLGGLGDLAVGGAGLVGKGFGAIASQSLQQINKLRGATGSYDLLQAVSKEHGQALIGSFKAGGHSIEGVAIHRNDQWYRFDPVKNRPYGPPLNDFKPKGSGLMGGIATGGPIETHFGGLQKNLDDATTPTNRPAYERGFSNGGAEKIPDYYPDIDTSELIELASKPNRTPEEVGMLAKEIKNKRIEDSKYASAVLRHDVAAPGVQVIPVSQEYYLAHVDLASKGECAGLSNAMAQAIHLGKEDQFMQNIYRAAAAPTAPASEKFIRGLRDFQNSVNNKHTFHMGPFEKKSPQDIIEDLTNSPTSKTLRIGDKNHGMIAGIKVENDRTSWFFYEPNSGMVKFETLRSMQEGMEKTLNSGGIGTSLSPYGSKRGVREYSVSEFKETDFDSANLDKAAVTELVSAPV